ncbi:MAG: hypothetical protein N3F66_09230 [Spirochaetes bacterium]|nr:hypothetical protein [Spirochaetota bacterium]
MIRLNKYNTKLFWAIAPLIVALAISACTKKAVRTGPFMCTVHGIHNCYDKSQIARCIGVNENELENYYMFSENGNFGDSSLSEAKLKSLVCDKIVEEVMLRIQMVYTDKQLQRWQFTDMSLPVIFRTFVKKDNQQEMIVIGFVKKDDLSPRAIIYYLPLEYKMDIIGRDKNNYKQPDW